MYQKPISFFPVDMMIRGFLLLRNRIQHTFLFNSKITLFQILLNIPKQGISSKKAITITFIHILHNEIIMKSLGFKYYFAKLGSVSRKRAVKELTRVCWF